MDNLHEALKVEEVRRANASTASVQLLLARLQHSKTHSILTVHANPTGWTSSGAQTTDLLATVGFDRRPCHFFHGECYVRSVPEGFDLAGFATALNDAFTTFCAADKHLERCGLLLPKSEGWGFFQNKRSSQRDHRIYSKPSSDGHRAPEVKPVKRAEDAVFSYVLTWLTGGRDKGWTIHLRPKHAPLSVEIRGAFEFLGGFSDFGQCPEFDFEPCHWRFTPFESGGRTFDGPAYAVTQAFDALATDFTPGLEMLLKTHATAETYGMGFLPIPTDTALRDSPPVAADPAPATRPTTPSSAIRRYKYDVALSFAGTERLLAEELATILRDNGVEVFFDDFYPEQLWGKDLGSHFDRIYRKESRFCVVFASNEYKNRMWPNAERRSAVARSIESMGTEYILPIVVEDVDLDGIPPTIGHVDVRKVSVTQIAELLLRKLAFSP